MNLARVAPPPNGYLESLHEHGTARVHQEEPAGAGVGRDRGSGDQGGERGDGGRPSDRAAATATWCTAAAAASLAASLLRRSIIPFLPETEAAAEPAKAAGTADSGEQGAELKGTLDQGVEMIELSSRASNCLKVAGIRTIGELVGRTEDDLLAVKNFGKKSLDEIKDKLKEMGLSLGMKVE